MVQRPTPMLARRYDLEVSEISAILGAKWRVTTLS